MATGAKRALILSGGGSRAAYQVGALKAVAELLPTPQCNPFPIICGTSAGAVNAAVLAAHEGCFQEAVADLETFWQHLQPADIYRHGWLEIVRSAGRIGLSLFNRGVSPGAPLSLLDNTPLRKKIKRHVRFQQIDRNIQRGSLEAVCVTAMSYDSGESVSFFQAAPGMKSWRRPRRRGRRTLLHADHVVASSAIPTLFPATRLEHEYYGDGALRQLAPISPALHLGASRVFTVGVSDNRSREVSHKKVGTPRQQSPSMAQIVGHLLNAAFVDNLEDDIQRLERNNRLLSLVPEEARARGEGLRIIDHLVVSPSQALDDISARHICKLPASLRFLLRTTGATRGGGATSASYLLFTPSFARELIELGYRDTLWNADAVRRFLADDEAT